MATPEKVKLEINIAGEPIQLTVPFQQQDSIRDIEKTVNQLYSDWRVRFPKKNPTELMAMILFQYASYYFGLRTRYERLTDDLAGISLRLDDLLQGPQSPATAFETDDNLI